MGTQTGWHVKNWGVLGWVETALKLAAVLVAVVMFFTTSSAESMTFGGHPRLFSVILLALLTLITVAQINLRLKLKDIIAMAFAVAYFIGHVCLLIGLLRVPTLTSYPIVFGVLVLLGDAVKLRFLTQTSYSEAGVETGGLLRLVYSLIAVYGLFIVGLVV